MTAVDKRIARPARNESMLEYLANELPGLLPVKVDSCYVSDPVLATKHVRPQQAGDYSRKRKAGVLALLLRPQSLVSDSAGLDCPGVLLEPPGKPGLL